MFFRVEFNARQQGQKGSLAQKDVSRLAGACWRKLPESEKKIYKDMANRERDIHMAKHPSYTYKYNDEFNHLRETGNSLHQPHVSMTPKASAAVLTDGTLPPALLSEWDWSFPNLPLGGTDENMLVLGEGMSDPATLDVFNDIDFDWHCVDPLYTVY